ncbi:MAG TPA: HlyD family secretion protein [Verrucomicrobiae bacterium]|nr:HlyD family secretion protein [Verrucomicrobiae bacterium]
MDEEQSRNTDRQQRDKPEQKSSGKPRHSFWTSGPVIVIGSIFLALIFFLGLRYFAESLTHETTDDAFLDGPIISVAPKVPGQVKAVYVRNNQHVNAGDVLVEIDPRDLAVAADQKRAAHASASANEELAKASLDLLRAQIAAAQATARQSKAEADASHASSEKAASDLKRAQDLMARKTISPQEFETAKTAAEVAKANEEAANEKAASDESKVKQAEAQLSAGVKAYERAEAQSAQAEIDTHAADLNLSYTHILAPTNGWVTRKEVEPGDYLQTGQRIMALVTDRLWVTANFKETQLQKIRTNQPATISIESEGGPAYQGYVESIQAGSGSRFSLLPPENAVGNYIKVVQRVPVRIFFNKPPSAQHVLGPGMSVSPSVRVKSWHIASILLVIIAAVLGIIAGALWWMLSRRAHS